MTPSQIEEAFAIGWFLLASQCDENVTRIACAAFGMWSIVFSILYAVRDFTQ